MNREEKMLIPTFRQIKMKQGRQSTGSQHLAIVETGLFFPLLMGVGISLEKPVDFM